MTTADVPITARETRTDHPIIRQITLTDLMDAIAKGLADFNAMPTHFFFLAIIYPIVTFGIAGIYGELDLLPFIFPLLAGYTILGPLAATGMYELSRRREFGRYTSRTNAFLVFKSHSINAIALLGIILMVIYFAWLYVAQLIYQHNFGDVIPESYIGFANQILTTQQGLDMMIAGGSVGFLFAVVVLSFSVVSFPMLLDLDVGVLTAIKTSIRAVAANPIIMAVWGVIVASSLLVGSLPAFVGLCIVLPILGHSTWHLYRKIVDC
ncbi:MAG: DUF2189 domain-containing protein [Rhodospirillaceae bacterium]|nr:DUF2189 domain-containing protein [Rhodospirillaceae bacterium]